jgi:16S rRNA (adenine1518-N6/adenine1519-N6)-dimethyltransferase
MDQELLDIVDEDDNVIGQDTKENKFIKDLITRNVAVFIMDNDRMLIVKRSPTKKTDPGKYDLAACGNVGAGESYEEAALREMKEELGIKCRLEFLGKLFNDLGDGRKYFTGIFLGHFSGEVVLCDELVELQRLTIEEIENMIKKNKNIFTPGFLKDFAFAKGMLR